MKEKKEKRFEVKSEQSFAGGTLHVVVDTETSVNYIVGSGLGPNFITPLIGADGKIVVDVK